MKTAFLSLSSDVTPVIKSGLADRWYKAEPVLIFLIAFAAFFLHVFYLGMPNLSLLFDSQGYLWVAESLQKTFSTDTGVRLLHYFASGFAEPARVELRESILGLADICKTGPVLTSYLAAFCAVCGKTAASTNWTFAAAGMILLQALTVCGIFCWSCSLWGRRTAWLSMLISLSYPGFVVNAGRPLSEIPLAACTTFFSFFLYRELAKSWASKEAGGNLTFGSKLKGGLFLGALLAVLMLARPTMIFLPVILLPVIFVIAKFCRRQNPLSAGMISGLLISAVLVLAPWMLCKQIFTGVPSLTVDRYGAWNIFAGTSLAADGWDMLPEEYVSHPDRFKASLTEVCQHISSEIKNRPGQMAYLLLRKPARLVDSPWNDFQAPSWGMPFAWQRFWHQLLFLTAIFGFFKLLARGWQKKDALCLLATGILGAIVLYQFVNCLFISMSRYFVAATPCVLMLAAYGLERVCFEFSGKRRLLLFLGLVSAPLLSCWLLHLYASGYGHLCEPARELGVSCVATVSALALSLCVAAGLFIVAGAGLSHNKSKVGLIVSGVLIAIFCFASSFDQFLALEGKLSVAKKKMEMSVDLPPEAIGKQLFLVMDSPYDSRTLAVNFNGRPLILSWLPLLAWDLSQRENLAYSTVFAYSGNSRVEKIRQWYCAPIPDSSSIAALSNKISFTAGRTADSPLVMCDLPDGCGENFHQLALRKFSWSKGFFANSPGEMRANVWGNRSATFSSSLFSSSFDIAQPDAKLRPRLYLLAVDSSDRGMGSLPIKSVDLKLPDQKVGLASSERMKTVEIAAEKLPVADGLSGLFTALHITVSGQCRTQKGKGLASIALIESSGTHQEYAPLAPMKIEASNEWNDFAFDDLLPAQGSGKSSPALRLLFLARPWWEALQYAEYKGKNPVEFRNLHLRCAYEPAMNLDKQKYELYQALIDKSDRASSFVR